MSVMESVLAVVFDGAPIEEDLVGELARSADAHAELVRLAATLAELPGDGARAAEERLDVLLDTVTLAAAGEVVRAAHLQHQK